MPLDQEQIRTTMLDIQLDQNGLYRVKAHTPLEDFDAAFGTHFADESLQTIGGLILHRFGRLPQFNEAVSIAGQSFRVLRADNRRIYTLVVGRAAEADQPG